MPPMSAEMAAAQKPMRSEIRAPATSIETMFAPPPSVPSGNSLLGGSKTSPTCSFGSSPTRSGPAMARKTKNASTASATSAVRLRRIGDARARSASERVAGASSAGGAPVCTGLIATHSETLGSSLK